VTFRVVDDRRENSFNKDLRIESLSDAAFSNLSMFLSELAGKLIIGSQGLVKLPVAQMHRSGHHLNRELDSQM
jgi:hypothetical protein